MNDTIDINELKNPLNEKDKELDMEEKNQSKEEDNDEVSITETE